MAGAQFLLTIIMLHRMAPADFGTFSFLLLAIQFSFGISNALFCAPLAALLASKGTTLYDKKIQSLFAVSLIFAVAMCLFFGMLGYLLGLKTFSVLLFAIYAAAALVRWFARAYSYAVEAPLRTISSDIVCSVVLLVGIAQLTVSTQPPAENAYLCLLISAVLGLLPFGWQQLRRQFGSTSLSTLANYREVWLRHSSWSLLGVITTEATANAHAYIIMLFSGSATFAGLAASGLVIRPTVVLTNALSEFERPRMARLIAQKQWGHVVKLASAFRLFLVMGWIISVLLAIVIFYVSPQLLIPKEYEPAFIKIGAALWLAVAAIRVVRSPESTMLQAAGMFRWLAYASMISSVFSIVAVIVFLLVGNPLWSIAGVICGEVVMTAYIWLQTSRWQKS